jgi:hypothetical protein
MLHGSNSGVCVCSAPTVARGTRRGVGAGDCGLSSNQHTYGPMRDIDLGVDWTQPMATTHTRTAAIRVIRNCACGRCCSSGSTQTPRVSIVHPQQPRSREKKRGGLMRKYSARARYQGSNTHLKPAPRADADQGDTVSLDAERSNDVRGGTDESRFCCMHDAMVLQKGVTSRQVHSISWQEI